MKFFNFSFDNESLNYSNYLTSKAENLDFPVQLCMGNGVLKVVLVVRQDVEIIRQLTRYYITCKGGVTLLGYHCIINKVRKALFHYVNEIVCFL